MIFPSGVRHPRVSNVRENISLTLPRSLAIPPPPPRRPPPRYSDGQRRLRTASINNTVVGDADVERASSRLRGNGGAKRRVYPRPVESRYAVHVVDGSAAQQRIRWCEPLGVPGARATGMRLGTIPLEAAANEGARISGNDGGESSAESPRFHPRPWRR